MSDESGNDIRKAVTEVQIAVASGFAAVNARLDASKDHEGRLRDLETAKARQLTREDVAQIVKSAIETTSRPTWQGLAHLVGAAAAGSGIVLALARYIS